MYTSIRDQAGKSVKFINWVTFIDTCFGFVPDPTSKETTRGCNKVFEKCRTSLFLKVAVIHHCSYNCTKNINQKISRLSETLALHHSWMKAIFVCNILLHFSFLISDKTFWYHFWQQ